MKAKPLVLALLLGFILRVPFLTHHDIWLDESVSILISRLPVSDILRAASFDNNPPLYYLLLHYWLKFGQNPIWLRLLSLIFSEATILAVYALAAFLTNKKVALFSAILTAIMPVQLYYAGEIRFYSLLILLSTLLFYLSFRKGDVRRGGFRFTPHAQARLKAWYHFLIRKPTGSHRSEQANSIPDLSFIYITLITTFLLLTHYSSIFVIATALVIAAKRSTRLLKSWIPGTLAGALLALPWFVYTIGKTHPLPWSPDPIRSILFLPIAATAGLTGTVPPSAFTKLPTLQSLPIAALALLFIGILVSRLNTHTKRVAVIALVATIVAVASVIPFLSPRLILPFTPALYLASAGTVVALTRLRNALLILSITAVFMNFLSPLRGPQMEKAIFVIQGERAPVFHTAVSTFYPALVIDEYGHHRYIGPKVFPSEFTQLVGGLPQDPQALTVEDKLVLLIDTANTTPSQLSTITDILAQSHELSQERMIGAILIQVYRSKGKLFATNHPFDTAQDRQSLVISH